MANLARVYLAQGQAAGRQALAVRRAVEIRRRVLHEGNWQTASAESLLGPVLVLRWVDTPRPNPCCWARSER